MINAVFDISNMFHRSMFVVGGFGSKSYTYDTQNEIDKLIRKVATDISYALRQVSPNRVIFAVDARSWRKGIKIEENEGYKGNREKSTHMNWTNIYAAMDDFLKIMSNSGFICSKIEGAEADDVMCLWRDELLYKRGQNVVLISGDEDIRQLVTSHTSGGEKFFSTVFNPFSQGKNGKKKLFVPLDFQSWLEEVDEVSSIFDRNVDTDKESFAGLLNTQVFLESINGIDVQTRKIFCGDDGDNIPAIYTWMGQTQKGGAKEIRITESHYAKIMASLGDVVHYSNLLDNHKFIWDKIAQLSKSKVNLVDTEERLKRQIKLIVLSPEIFPEAIVTAFNENVEENLKKTPDKSNGWYMQNLLAGTRYVDESYQKKQTEASIFREIDKISQKLF